MKKILFLLPVAFLAASPTLATESRVQGMGGIGLYMMDDTNIFVFPQTLSKHSNMGQFELGAPNTSDANRTGGGTVHLPRLGATAGLYLNRSAGAPLLESNFNAIDPGAENRLIFAKNHWGVSLGMGGDGWEDKETEAGDRSKETGSNFSVGAGGDFRLGEAAGQLGAEVAFGSGKVEFDDSAASEIDESAFAIRVANRNFYNRGSAGKLVSVVTLGLASSDIDPDGDALFERKATTFGFGAGWHYPAGKKTTVILGIEPFGFAKSEDTTTNGANDETVETSTVVALPALFLAVEGKIKTWLHGRAGISQSNRRNSSKTEFTPDGGDTVTDETTFSDSDINISMGLSVLLGDHFTIDGVFNDSYLHNGFNFMSGVTGQPVLAQVSAKVAW